MLETGRVRTALAASIRAIVEHLKCWILPPPFAVTKAWSLPVSLLWYMQNPWLSEPSTWRWSGHLQVRASSSSFRGSACCLGTGADGTDDPPVCV